MLEVIKYYFPLRHTLEKKLKKNLHNMIKREREDRIKDPEMYKWWYSLPTTRSLPTCSLDADDDDL